jgi:hypothetical protein
MKKIQSILFLLLLLAGMTRVSAQTSTEIDKATKSGKSVFLVAYAGSSADANKAFAVAEETKKSFTGSSLVIKMNTTDATNKDLVTKYRLAGAPLPLIIVLDKNGTIAGGLPLKDATPAKLVDMVPSPKTSEILKAIAEGKSVYVVAYKANMPNQKSIMDNCAMACGKMDNKSVTVKVDLTDKNETKLIQNLKCDMNAKEPVTYVINKSGQVVSTHNGITDVNTLVSSAKKAPAGGCCPGGSSSAGCGPKK